MTQLIQFLQSDSYNCSRQMSLHKSNTITFFALNSKTTYLNNKTLGMLPTISETLWTRRQKPCSLSYTYLWLCATPTNISAAACKDGSDGCTWKTKDPSWQIKIEERRMLWLMNGWKRPHKKGSRTTSNRIVNWLQKTERLITTEGVNKGRNATEITN